MISQRIICLLLVIIMCSYSIQAVEDRTVSKIEEISTIKIISGLVLNTVLVLVLVVPAINNQNQTAKNLMFSVGFPIVAIPGGLLMYSGVKDAKKARRMQISKRMNVILEETNEVLISTDTVIIK